MLDGGGSADGLSHPHPSTGQQVAGSEALDRAALASRPASALNAAAAQVHQMDSLDVDRRGCDVQGMVDTEPPIASPQGPGQVSAEHGQPGRGMSQLKLSRLPTANQFRLRLEKMLVRGGPGPVLSGNPKDVEFVTNRMCLAALEGAEQLYDDNGWAKIGTMQDLGYRVDTYEATAYVLGDAFLGRIIPPNDARTIGQRARKCRGADDEAQKAAKTAKKAAKRASKDENAAAGAAVNEVMARKVTLPWPSVQKCVGHQASTGAAPAAGSVPADAASEAAAPEAAAPEPDLTDAGIRAWLKTNSKVFAKADSYSEYEAAFFYDVEHNHYNEAGVWVETRAAVDAWEQRKSAAADSPTQHEQGAPEPEQFAPESKQQCKPEPEYDSDDSLRDLDGCEEYDGLPELYWSGMNPNNSEMRKAFHDGFTQGCDEVLKALGLHGRVHVSGRCGQCDSLRFATFTRKRSPDGQVREMHVRCKCQIDVGAPSESL